MSPPSITGATLYLGTGILELFADETVDLSPSTEANLSKLVIANTTGDGFFVFPNDHNRISGKIGRNGKIDGVTFNISISEWERVQLIAASNTPGGDKSTLVLDAHNGFIHDIGLKDNLDNLNIPINEIADTIRPVVEKAVLNFTDGILVVTTNEIIDTTPVSRVNLSKIILTNVTSFDPLHGLTLVNSRITAYDDFRVVLKLSEPERVRGIQISNTAGGDNGAAFLSLLEGAFYDVGRNDNIEKLHLPIIEIADTLKPSIFSVAINFSTGIIRMNVSETIDGTPNTNINTTSIRLFNSSPGDSLIILVENVIANDDVEVVMKLNEDQRVIGIKNSGSRGGDGTPLSVIIESGAVRDIAQNGNAETNLVLIEHDDIVHPVPLMAIINFTHGTVVLNFSETILSESVSDYNLGNIYLSDIPGQQNISLGDSIAESSFVPTVKFTLSETTRVKGIEHSATPGGDSEQLYMDVYADAFQDVANNYNFESFGVKVIEFPDILNPTILSGKIFLGDGHVTLLASETLDLTPLSNLNLSRMFLANVTGDRRIPLIGVDQVIAEDRKIH